MAPLWEYDNVNNRKWCVMCLNRSVTYAPTRSVLWLCLFMDCFWGALTWQRFDSLLQRQHVWCVFIQHVKHQLLSGTSIIRVMLQWELTRASTFVSFSVCSTV